MDTYSNPTPVTGRPMSTRIAAILAAPVLVVALASAAIATPLFAEDQSSQAQRKPGPCPC